jgi:hypothetical protein
MSDESNVIAFPKKRRNTPFSTSLGVETEEDVDERVEAVHRIHISNILDAIVDTLIQQLIVGGFEIDDDDALPLSFISESIHSLMSEHYGLYHPFQDVMEKTMIENGEGVYQIRENIATQHNEKGIDASAETITADGA